MPDEFLVIWSVVKEILQFAIQVGLLALLIYMALLFLQGTRAAPILLGIVIITTVGWILSKAFGLEVFEWLLLKVPTLMAFALIIIFQPELRRVFAEIGKNPNRIFKAELNTEETIEVIIEASQYMAKRHTGALIAIERDIGMRAFSESGVQINAPVTSKLLLSIFYPNSPLHDGAVIIQDDVINAAACFFPLTQNPLDHFLGTRHRAAVGITEETDAIAIVVSEETGNISLAYRGRLVVNVDEERLRRHLTNYLIKQKDKKKTVKVRKSAKTIKQTVAIVQKDGQTAES